MEGGNKTPINLEAGLDVNTSDMLVSLSNQTFQHNWQKFQGKFLPNSLRFEKNGWAAGWNVYNFNYNIFRKQLADHVYIGLGQLNSYVKILSVYETETSTDSKQDYYIIDKSALLHGDASVDGNIIRGKVNDKEYELEWNPNTKTLSSLTPDISVETVLNTDYTSTLTVKDDTSSFDFDFNLLLADKLTGDSIEDVNYMGFDEDIHSWGNYKYNVTTNELNTPEGVIVVPSVDQNELSFDYSAVVTDEALKVAYSIEKFYPRFDNLHVLDKCLVGENASELLQFNRFYGTFNPTTLLAKDEAGVKVDMTVPVWLTFGFTVAKTNPNAKWCDNVKNFEVALAAGTGIGNKVKYKNIYTKADGTETLTDYYRVVDTACQYIKNLSYRFNQILVGNTIEPGTKWSPYKYTVNTNDVWVFSTKRYSNLRNKRIGMMTAYLGDVYDWGTFTYRAEDYIAQNAIWKWDVATNVVYTEQDISEILSIKKKGTADNVNTGDDHAKADTWGPTEAQKLAMIATLTGTTHAYSETQAAKTYDELYTNGVYTGGTYVNAEIGTLDSGLWPFEKVPKYNLKLADDTEVKGVYWTDGTNHITSFAEFRNKVLGDYDSDIEADNDMLVENKDYSRTRLIKKYRAGYDFNFIDRDDYDADYKYQQAKKEFNEVWSVYYPTISSPVDYFDPAETYDDNTYLTFNDTEIIDNVKPKIYYVRPGVYVGTPANKVAMPYNSESGIIIYDTTSSYTLVPSIHHHNKDATSEYRELHATHTAGSINIFGYGTVNLPFYFDTAESQSVVLGVESPLKFTEYSIPSENITPASLDMHINMVPSSGGGWTPVMPAESNWVRCAHVYISKGKITTERFELNDGLEGETLSELYVLGSINDGLKCGIVLKGHTSSILKYPEMLPYSKINNDDAFSFEFNPDVDNDRAIYVDRDTTRYSQRIFEVIENTKQPDDAQGGGSYTISLKDTQGDSLYFAKKQTNTTTGQEIIYDSYIPGIAWGNRDYGEGHMQQATELPSLKINWTPVIYNIPTQGLVSFNPVNSLNSQHKFYTTDKALLTTASITIGDFDVDNLILSMTLTVNGIEIPLSYDVTTGVTSTDLTDAKVIDNSNEVVEIPTVGATETAFNIPLYINLLFNNNKARFFLPDVGYDLLSATADTVKILHDDTELVYNVNTQNVVSPKADVSVDFVEHGQHIKAEGAIQVILSAILQSVYEGLINDSVISFDYKGNTYTFDLAEKQESVIQVVSTDIRKPDKTKLIGRIIPDNEYQLLKQQWNTTVEVENFWWIDSLHVLELNKTSFVLKRNTKELHDWNGNRFENVYEIPRDLLLPSNVIRYFVPSSYNYTGIVPLVTMQEDGNSILVKLYNTRRGFRTVSTFNIIISQKDLGQILNDASVSDGAAQLNTYNPLSVYQVLSRATWSSTLVDNRLIIGCHLSNNYDQWTIVYNMIDLQVEKVIQGYGFVGLHGDLTGGMLPNDYMDADRGFNDRVQPLSIFERHDRDINNVDAMNEVNDLSTLNRIDPKVVGTTEQQWYIKLKLFGVVSHLTYKEDGNFEKQVIPITNNYISMYKSPSFSSSVLGDAGVQVTGFDTLFKFPEGLDALWKTFMGFLGMPLMYSVAPRYAYLAYLQQSFGQYAYVHYNSSKSMPEQEPQSSTPDSGMDENVKKTTNPVLSSAYTFDLQKFSQAAGSQLDYFGGGMMAIMIAAFSEAMQILDKKVSVNEEQNQTATSDVGKKYLANVVGNVGDMLATAIVTQSKNDTGVTSVISGLKNLDMFYSTSDQQHVMAGPGFVEQQFVADCVAQSVTDTQVEGKVQQFYFCIRALTTMQINIEIALEEIIAEGLDKAAEATAAQMVCGTSLGAVAVGIHAVAEGIRAAISAQKVALVEIDKILDAVCAKGITVNVDGTVTRHALSVEGQHKYGEKNEVFMWPCWGIKSGQLKYTDEWVNCGVKNTPWQLTLTASKYFNGVGIVANAFNIWMGGNTPKYSSCNMDYSAAFWNVGRGGAWNIADSGADRGDDGTPANTYRGYRLEGKVPFYQISPFGESAERDLPDDMAKIEGVNKFLPDEPFKNENIGMSQPAFAPSLIHDYIIDKNWDLAQCASYGLSQWVTVKDTKLTNCPPSNIVVTSDFCGVACPYTAIEVKRGISKEYMRPWAITPNTLAFNVTGYNTILDDVMYHAFDGMSQRIVDLIGSPGMNKNRQSFIYAIQVNDRFKRSNIIPANEAQGNFESEPVMAMSTIDPLWVNLTIAAKEKGLAAGTVGEDKDGIRWSIPLFTEPVSTLPAVVKTMAARALYVDGGVTSLVTNKVTDTQAAYKAPISVDFTIGKNTYRATEEYICTIQAADAGDVVTDIIPSLGLTFIGSTPSEAYFYSKSTRCYYLFTGSSLTKMDMMERFRDVQKGYWDFVNQEVVMPCLMTYKRLNAEVEDKDTETDNIIVPVLSKSQVSGELPVPITTIFNDRSWYKCVSLPCGLAYQGPNRVIINRAIFCEYMERSMKENFGKWKKLNREKYTFYREYPEKYTRVDKDVQGVDGWTHNPFVLVTSPLGQNEDTDCVYEWVITFCWPVEMDLLYGTDNYACVNIAAETMTPGGKVMSRPTHVFLTKELFTRTGNYGYYSFRYQSKNGAGNRERLHIWSDQYIAISSIDCDSKVITSRRTEQLTQQIDIQKLKEL